jgi:C4-dicarboxylate-specific signal transduction histidine kinase
LRAPFARWLDELNAPEGGPKTRQWQVLDARGQTLAVDVTGLPWPDYAGGPALLLVARDVTERTRLHAQVVRADRLAALGVLAAGVSHEINNPLAYIRAAVDHLREVTPTLLKSASAQDRSEIDECLTDAAEGVARISDLVTDFRTFSKASRERALVDVRRLAEATARVAQGEVKRRAQFEVDVASISPVRTDESQLGQVLLNLIIHAARSIEAGAPQANRVTLKAFEDASDVVFRLQDTGPGIPPGLLDHIFEPFAATRTEDAHSGLGLSVSHTLAQSLGGSLRVVETSSRGTTFELRLPRSADAA